MHKTIVQFATVTENGVVKQIGRSLIEQPKVKGNQSRQRKEKANKHQGVTVDPWGIQLPASLSAIKAISNNKER